MTSSTNDHDKVRVPSNTKKALFHTSSFCDSVGAPIASPTAFLQNSPRTIPDRTDFHSRRPNYWVSLHYPSANSKVGDEQRQVVVSK
jgi:hypothetical protein